jgi:hypothetical protein
VLRPHKDVQNANCLVVITTPLLLLSHLHVQLRTQSIAAPGNRNIQPTPYLKIWYQSRPLVYGTIGVCLDLQAKVNAKAAKAHLQIAITTLFEAAIFTLFRSADREIQNAGRPIHSVRNLLES